MPKGSPKELGARTPFSLRAGIDVPRFGGINKQRDPGAIGDEEFQELINVDWKETKLVNRAGLTKLHSTALDGEVRGLFDPTLAGAFGGDSDLQEVAGVSDCSPTTGYGTAGARLFWLGTDSCTSDPALFYYAPDQSPVVQKSMIPSAVSLANGIHGDGEVLWVHTSANSAGTATPQRYLKHFTPRAFGSTPYDVLAFSHTLATGAASPFGQAGMARFLRDLYIGSSVAPNSIADAVLNAWRWDGRTLTLEDTVTLSAGSWTGNFLFSVGLCQFREELIEAICATTGNVDVSEDTTTFSDKIRKRSTAGSWSNISLPGTVSHFSSATNNPVVYKDKCYIFGLGIMPGVHATNSGGIVLSYDGSSLSVAQNVISGVVGAGTYTLRSPVVFDGYLYYLYTPGTSTTTVNIGRFDGSSWNNTYKVISSQFAVAAAATDYHWLIAYQGKLYAGVNSAGETSRLIASPGTSVNGTWTTVFSRASDNGQLFQYSPSQFRAGFRASVM